LSVLASGPRFVGNSRMAGRPPQTWRMLLFKLSRTACEYNWFADGPGRAIDVWASLIPNTISFPLLIVARHVSIGRNQKFWQTAVGVCFQGRVTEQPRWSRGKKYRISTCSCYERDRDRQGTTRTIESQNLKNLVLSHRNLTVEFTSLNLLGNSVEFAN
jgi:hypothetical protein